MTTSWSQFLSHPWAVGGVAYLIIGALVRLFIAARGMRLRQPPTSGLFWEKKDHARNALFLLLCAGDIHPIGFLIEVALWPLWILFLWAFREDDDD